MNISSALILVLSCSLAMNAPIRSKYDIMIQIKDTDLEPCFISYHHEDIQRASPLKPCSKASELADCVKQSKSPKFGLDAKFQMVHSYIEPCDKHCFMRKEMPACTTYIGSVPRKDGPITLNVNNGAPLINIDLWTAMKALGEVGSFLCFAWFAFSALRALFRLVVRMTAHTVEAQAALHALTTGAGQTATITECTRGDASTGQSSSMQGTLDSRRKHLSLTNNAASAPQLGQVGPPPYDTNKEHSHV